MSPRPLDSDDYDRLFLKVTALVDACQQLANAVLQQSQSTNKISPILTNIRNDIHELLTGDQLGKANLELRLRNIDSNLALALKADFTNMATHIALILAEVSDVKSDVDGARGDITNTRIELQKRAKAEDEKPANGFVASMRAFDALPRGTKLMVLAIVMAALGSGWLKPLIGKLFGTE